MNKFGILIIFKNYMQTAPCFYTAGAVCILNLHDFKFNY